MYAKYVNPHYMVLHVLASAGTYIKELVHGDLGRTTPSVGSILGTECDILQLDVTNVYDNLSEAQEQLESLFEVTIPQIKD
jgi:tRNA U54 and U55 pseudouridine synthase Pus10